MIIGITGLKGSGKTVAADYIGEICALERRKFAGPLKDMCRVLLKSWLPASEHTMIERYLEGDLKEELIPGLLVTPRELMQTLGTEWGRHQIDNSLWVKMQERHFEGGSILMDDVRFDNERRAIKSHGGYVIRVDRPDVTRDLHESESVVPADWVVLNDGTIEALHTKLAKIIETIRNRGG